MSDMATMPIPELVAGIREKAMDMDPLHALTFGVLAGRLQQEYERAEIYAQKAAGTCVIDKVTEALGPQTLTSVENYKRMESASQALRELQEKVDNCEYHRCPCR